MLELATEGCCKGHACDNCKTCQSGRCCRKDNPDYKLPALGEWDGPIYGELGVLNDDGEKVECHCCGEWYLNLGTHIGRRHDLAEKEYKSIFGLHLSRGLLSESEHVRRRQSHQPHLAALIAAGRATSPVYTFTPEQRSGFSSRGLNVSVIGNKGRFRQGYAPPNKTKDSYTGVWWSKRDARWTGEIVKDKIRYHLGYFKTEHAAAHAYDSKALELYGDKARLNFPDA